MIPFKDIELKDKDLITSFTLNSPRRNCDLSFSNLCSWRFLYNTKFAIMDGFLLLKFWADGELVYMMPIGNGDLNKVLDADRGCQSGGEPFACWGSAPRNVFRTGNFHARQVPLLQRTGITPITYICALTSPPCPAKSFRPNGIISTIQKTYNYEYTPITADRIQSASIWKRNGAKSTTSTSMKVQATNVAH